nr:phospholipase D beta 1-like [Tanacetum cinerariifolium]
MDICVQEADKLPNMDAFNKMFAPISGNSDPYVTVSAANAVIGRTFLINSSENPVWMQHFCMQVALYATEVSGSQLIGAVGIPAELLVNDFVVKDTFPILNARAWGGDVWLGEVSSSSPIRTFTPLGGIGGSKGGFRVQHTAQLDVTAGPEPLTTNKPF